MQAVAFVRSLQETFTLILIENLFKRELILNLRNSVSFRF